MGGDRRLVNVFWLDLAPRDGATQMALDHAALDLAEAEGVQLLRLYRWAGDTVSFGANEAAARHWNREGLAVAGVPVVRRPTGGRAVWHAADDLTYAVTAPLAAVGGLRPGYRMLHERLAAALATVGLASTLAPAPARLPGLAAGACFDVAVGGELVVGGRKAVGSAQLTQGHALLQHGAIARADRLPALARFRLDAPLVGAWDRPVDLPSAERLADAIRRTWTAEGAVAAPATVTARLLALSEAQRRYRDPAWTWRR